LKLVESASRARCLSAPRAVSIDGDEARLARRRETLAPGDSL